MVQLLTPEGERVEHPDYPLDISDDEMRALYRDLVLVRRIDTEAIALQRQGELGLWASLLGQEAAQIGAGRALRPQDMAFPTYREHGVAWCQGVDPLTLLGLFRGTNLGGWNPHDNNFNLYTIVIGAQTLHAAGYAMGVMRDGAVGTGDPDRDTAVLAFFGDGASSQGDVNESFVWAAADNLPVVFFCQNNQWAISAPVATPEPGAAVPAGERFRLPRHAHRRQRRAGQPGGHPQGARRRAQRPGSDADRGVHLPDERAHHIGRPEPLPPRRRAGDLEAAGPDRARALLPQSAQPIGPDFFDGRRGRVRGMAEHVRSGCRALPDPDPLSVFDHVHVELTQELREQRDEFARYLASVEDRLVMTGPITLAKASTRACARPWRTTPRS